ncbi:MAG: hypothetical protein U0625_00920 [Phycisphaerales bacterium]
MRSVRLAVIATTSLLGIAPLAGADMTNFRDWIDANGLATNSTSNLWYGTTGVGGALMASGGNSWYSPGYPFGTPLFGPLTEPGSDNGAAGPATFSGVWAHPGSGVPAALVFAPQSATWASGMSVRSELILNGLSGNGVTITVLGNIGGNAYNFGTTTLTGTNDQTDFFSFGGPVQLSAGDTISVVIGDNGSYLYDHVNFNAWLDVPAPGSIALLLAGGLARRRRRG